MRKIIARLFVVFLVTLLGSGIVKIIVDSQETGFFTISNVEKVAPKVSSKQTEFLFVSKENFLGTVGLKLDEISRGNFIFRIKEIHAPTWYYQSTFDTRQLRGLQIYPFGFPQILDSKNKQYVVQIVPIKDAKVLPIVTNNKTTIVSKYVFTKAILLHNKFQLLTFLYVKVTFLLLSSYDWVLYGIVAGIACAYFLNLSSSKSNYSLLKNLVSIPKKGFTKKGWFLVIVFLGLFLYGNIILPEITLLSLSFLLVLWLLTNIYNHLASKLSFLIAVGSVLVFPLSVIIHQTTLAERVATWVWFFIFAGVLLTLRDQINFVGEWSLLLKKVKKVPLRKYRMPLLLIGIIFLVLFISTAKIYILGGDDTKLYYVYPWTFYQNFVSKIGPDSSPSTLVSLLPPSSIAPFVLLLSIMKLMLPFSNLQILLFLLNIIGGFGFFYLLLGQISTRASVTYKPVKLLASFMYVFSIFNFYTLFNSQLIALYLLSSFPLSIYLFIRGVREKKAVYIVGSALIWTVFAFLSASLPWVAGAIIILLPLLFLFLWEYKVVFIKYSLLFIMLLTLLNSYWLLRLPYSAVSNTSTSIKSNLISSNFREQAEKGVIVSVKHNKVFYPLLNSFFYDIQNDFQWSQLQIYNSWYRYLLPLNIIFPLIIVVGGLLLYKKSQLKRDYAVLLLCFLLGIYFFTVNVGPWGNIAFLWLIVHIPGFVMFRNTFDKFPYALSIGYALIFGLSLHIVVSTMHNKRFVRGIYSIVFIILLLNALPFVKGDFYKLPIWTTVESYNDIHSLNRDYLNLVSYIQSTGDGSRYLWLPLEYGNIIQIPDQENRTHYYNGLSPLLILSGENDYSGQLSFDNYGQEVIGDILQHKYTDAGYLFQRLNAKYVIVNKTISYDLQQSYIFSNDLYDAQGKQYQHVILGKKIKDFGTRYSLYEINPKFANKKIYITHDAKTIPTNLFSEVTYNKISSDEYQVTLRHVTKNVKLVLLDPYFRDWSIFSPDKKIALITGKHERVFTYANGWNISVGDLIKRLPQKAYMKNSDGTYNLQLSLLFTSPVYFTYAFVISIVTFCLSAAYLMIYFINR